MSCLDGGLWPVFFSTLAAGGFTLVGMKMWLDRQCVFRLKVGDDVEASAPTLDGLNLALGKARELRS